MPVAGGRWYERAEDGSRVRLGPRARDRPPEPHPAGLAADARSGVRPGPAKATQVEVTFDAEESGTRVTLTHSGFEVHGEAGAAMRESVGGDGGWAQLMDLYKNAA